MILARSFSARTLYLAANIALSAVVGARFSMNASLSPIRREASSCFRGARLTFAPERGG
jgi:hypothetical protein